MQAGATYEALEVGARRPDNIPFPSLGPGEVGYLIAGIKDVGEARSGETVTEAARPGDRSRSTAIANPSRWCSAGSTRSTATSSSDLRESLEKLRLNDLASPTSPRRRARSGFGFRCGFLGLLHMEIVRERLEREFDLNLIATAPSVEYRVETTDGSEVVIDNPAELPPITTVDRHPGAVPQLLDHHAQRVRRHADGPVPVPPRRDWGRWTTSRPSGSTCTTACRSPRS